MGAAGQPRGIQRAAPLQRQSEGHAAGSLASVLESTGLPKDRAEALQHEIAQGGVLLGVHVTPPDVERVRATLSAAGATSLEIVEWKGSI